MYSNLDFLRASAVLMVLTAHLVEINGHLAEWTIKLGHAGVMLFFVHTALVLMQSLDRLEAESPGKIAARFYIRRALRIYPLPVFMVSIVTLLAWTMPVVLHTFFANYRPGTREFLSNLFLVQNLTGAKDILIVMWSLPPEVQMYLTLPLFHRTKWIANNFTLFWAGCVIFLTFLVGHGIFGYLLYLPMFIPGIIAYQTMKEVTPRFPSWLWPVCLALPVAVYIAFANRAQFFAWLLCLSVGMMIPHFKMIRSGAAVSKMIARYSYGIYLVHTPCIFVCFYALRGHGLLLKVACTLALTAAVSVILFHLIESPLLNRGTEIARGLVRRGPDDLIEFDIVRSRGAGQADNGYVGIERGASSYSGRK